MDVILNVQDLTKKVRSKNLNFSLSWLKFYLNDARNRGKNFISKRFSSIFKAEYTTLIDRWLKWITFSTPPSIRYNLITKYIINKENSSDGILVFEIDLKHEQLTSIEIVFQIKYEGILSIINNWFWLLNIITSIIIGSAASIILIMTYLVCGGNFGVSYLLRKLGNKDYQVCDEEKSEYKSVSARAPKRIKSSSKLETTKRKSKKTFAEDYGTTSEFDDSIKERKKTISH